MGICFFLPEFEISDRLFQTDGNTATLSSETIDFVFDDAETIGNDGHTLVVAGSSFDEDFRCVHRSVSA